MRWAQIAQVWGFKETVFKNMYTNFESVEGAGDF